MLTRALIVLSMTLLASCTEAPAPKPSGPLRFGVLPAIDAEATKSNYDVLAKGLAAAVGRPVDVVVAKDYDALGKDLAGGRVDLAQISAYLHVLLQLGTHDPLVQEKMGENEKYRGVFVVKDDSPVKAIADLKGKRFAWVHAGSSAGFHYGRMRLRELELDPGAHFKETVFAGSHAKAVQMVQKGEVDGAVVSALSVTDASKLRIIERTAVIPDDVIAAGTKVSQADRDAIRKFFLVAHEKNEIAGFLKSRGVKQYIAPNPEDYLALSNEMVAGR